MNLLKKDMEIGGYGSVSAQLVFRELMFLSEICVSLNLVRFKFLIIALC